MRNMIRALLLAAVALSLLAMSGCSAKQENKPAPTADAAPAATTAPSAETAAAAKNTSKESRIGFFLDTVVTLTAYTDHPELLEVPPEHVRYEAGLEYHEPKIQRRETDAGAAANL